MKTRSRALVALAVALATLCFCAGAGAANVTIGPTLAGLGWESEECEGTTPCTVVNYELGGTGPVLTSPVNGEVVRFSVLGGSTPGAYRLRTVRPGESSVSWFFKTEGVGLSVVPNPGIQSYGVALPISAGETVALTMTQGASISFEEGVGRSSEWWATEPPANGHILGISEPGVFGFNAEVQPAPTITSLGTTSGPMTGGTTVQVNGADLENATGVTFGSTPATSFTAGSESSLTAVAPSSAAAAAVPVSVITIAGHATSAQPFTYEAPAAPPPAPRCAVPKLTGKKLKAAKKALRQARCRLGKVKKSKGATGKSGEVAGQSPKPGTSLPVRSKVNVTLKPGT